MSDAGIAESRPDFQEDQRHGRPALAIVLAVLLAATVGGLTYQLGDKLPLGALVILAAASLLGLLAAFGAIAGFVHFGRLPKQRTFFDGLADAIGDACAVTDKHGRVIYANARYRELLKTSGASRPVGIENLYAGYPDIADRIYRLAQAAREGERSVEEFRLNSGSAAAGARQSAPAWFRASVSPISPSVGKRFTLWRLTDITADRERQENAFSNLQYIINYLDHSPAGFFSTTSDGKIAYVNATLADWLGLDLSETTDGSLMLENLVDEAGAKLIMGLKPENGSERTEVFDLDLKGREGTPLPVRIIHRTDFDLDGKAQPSRSLVLDKGAGPVKLAGASEAEIRMARLFNNAPIGVAELDKDGVIANTNSAFLDMSGAAARGAPVTELVLERDRETVQQTLQLATDDAKAAEPVDVTFVGSEQRTGQMYFVPAGADDTGDREILVYAVDTTRHSSLEAQLAQGQKMQAVGQLAGGVAHDFNNVLTAIIGFSDLLLAKHRPTDPAFADIMNIKQNANRAANLVRQLLAFSRRQTLRPEVLSLTDVLSDLGNLLGRLLGEKIELKVAHGRDVGLVKVDVNQFEQVVINLAVNARDAMPDGGVLSVRTANVSEQESRSVNPSVMPEGRYVLCEISDTGTGMPPDVLAKIYEPFFSTKEVGKGTGLGLSTVYGIVKQTGGFIFCDSELGKGTTFSIYLPEHVRDQVAEVEDLGSGRAESERADLTGKGTILLVEDEDAVRSFASRALASRGYTVLEADSGESALEVVESQSGEFDLVLSDVVMPEMDGPTLLKELRKRGIGTKVVFISGYAEDAFEKNLEGQDDFAFLPKPFTLKQLAEAVKDAMAT